LGLLLLELPLGCSSLKTGSSGNRAAALIREQAKQWIAHVAEAPTALATTADILE